MSNAKLKTTGLAHEEQMIQKIVMAVEESWNRHDMDAFADLLTEDVEWVNPAGMWWRGKADVKHAHQAYHESFFKETTRHAESINIQRLGADVAVVLCTYRMSDFVTPDGRQWTNHRDRMTYVLLQHQGQWLITRGHVTNIDAGAAPFDPIKRS